MKWLMVIRKRGEVLTSARLVFPDKQRAELVAASLAPAMRIDLVQYGQTHGAKQSGNEG